MKLTSCTRVKLIGRVCPGFLALGAVAGCSAIEVGLGLRTRLDKVPVTGVSATLSPDPGLAPGKPKHLIITATTSDAKQLVTVGAGHGNVLFGSFAFAATTVTVSKKGVVSLQPQSFRANAARDGLESALETNQVNLGVDLLTRLRRNPAARRPFPVHF